MSKIVRVLLWGEEVGRLSWDERRRTSFFSYNPEWLKKGVDIAPVVAPVSNARPYSVIWGEEQKAYNRLPSFIADSLPDAWGNQLFNLWRQGNHLSNSEVTPLEKLSFIGKRGMGALEFEPVIAAWNQDRKVDINALATLAGNIYRAREDVHIDSAEDLTMQSLLSVGTSAGGRKPKAIVAVNRKTGEFRSGQIAGKSGYDYCIIKFGDSDYSSSELEMAYYEMALSAGIRMMPSRLVNVSGNMHFLTSRFDRDGERKIHIQTLAAMDPDADSYEDLISLCRRLHLRETDCEEVFRRMVFNHLSNNTDDHNKNFSFSMNESGVWSLAPAYDLTYIFDGGGFHPVSDHCLFSRSKLVRLTHQEALDFANDNGIRHPEAIIRKVADAISKFRSLAVKNGVKMELIGRIEPTLNGNLSSWNLSSSPVFAWNSKVIAGHSIGSVRLEQSYKGNYHLFATIDGVERKYVIGKNKSEYSNIEQTGLCNMTEDQLLDMVKKYIF